MYVFDIDAAGRALEATGASWKQFLRVEALSAGLLRLKSGERDPQQPHTEDEVYFVMRGRARFVAGTSEHEVKPGTVIYVEAGREHRFESVEEDLEALVVFAPAEGSGRPAE